LHCDAVWTWQGCTLQVAALLMTVAVAPSTLP